MNFINPSSRYSTLSITLHWLMLVLLAVVFATIELRGLFPKGTEGRTLITETIYKLPPAGTATTAASTATSTAQLAAKLEHANLTLACAKARNDEFFMQQGFALRYRYHYTDGRAIADFTLDRARCASAP